MSFCFLLVLCCLLDVEKSGKAKYASTIYIKNVEVRAIGIKTMLKEWS